MLMYFDTHLHTTDCHSRGATHDVFVVFKKPVNISLRRFAWYWPWIGVVILVTADDGIISVTFVNAQFVLDGGADFHGWLHKQAPPTPTKAPKIPLTSFGSFDCQPCLVAVDIKAHASRDGKPCLSRRSKDEKRFHASVALQLLLDTDRDRKRQRTVWLRVSHTVPSNNKDKNEVSCYFNEEQRGCRLAGALALSRCGDALDTA